MGIPSSKVQAHIDTCSSKGDETNTGSTQSHGIRPEDNILGNKDYTHFNVNTKSAEYSKRNDQFDSGPVSQDKSDTASCPNVQTTNSDNYEQTDSITTNHGTKTKKNKKKKKKKGIVTPVMPEPSEPMKAGTTEQEVTDVKDKMRPCSPKETESPAGDAKYEGKTPTAPQDNFQGHADFLNTQITVHNNRIGTCSSKRNETTTRSTQNHGIRLEDNILSNKDNIFGNKDNTHFNVKNTHSEVYSKSSESTNGNVQTKAQIKEHSIINLNDIGGNDITQHDQYDIGSVSHDKSDTASCPIVQTANSDNYEQTDPITTNDGKETQKKKNKKKKGILTSLIPKPSKSMKTETTQCRPLQGEDTGVKNKMRHEPLEHMKAETTVYLLKQQNETGVKDEMRPEPMKAETPSYLLKQKDETGVKDEMRTEPPETMTTETTPYLFKQQDENGVKDEMRPEPMKAESPPYLLKQQDETGVKDEMSVTEQQLKTMTMEAERLTERCRYDIETSNANDKELKLCLKAFIQSISSVEKYISNLVLENSKLVMEKNEYLNRLSSAAGARLTDNNPNITNLHDPNRPMKLAEKFNKIYDDEWTDMIEMLEKKGHTTEEHKDNCVYHLYSVLIVIFNSLSKKAEVQLKGLGKHLFLLTKPSTEQINATWYDYKEERVQLIASRKKTAETTILMLYQTLQTDPIFLQELCECSPPLDDVMLSDILPSEYFMKCVEICWYFVIQDPPMYVETVSLKGIKIDKDTHKVYTKSGDIVKYHVWPALYLHHQDGTNSPLMGKGVVQPK